MAKPLRHLLATLLLLSPIVAINARADGARFDLAGPKIDIRVTRNGVSLPIALVPNLMPGDVIWLHADLPPTQSVHYLLIAAFLRGNTNPPPDDWFTRIETWNKKTRDEGVSITVPQDAQQAVLFLAPETGGDYSTLKSAVRGRPGVFVRASQDLQEAGFEQSRIEKYLAEMQKVADADAATQQNHSNLLARTLNLKPNPDCYKKPLDQQYSCLTQSGNQNLLDDGHGQTVAEALSNGPSSDLINQASYTQMAGAGVYSAYVGAIVDLVRLTSTIHVAHFQYIPAIAFPSESSLNLRLNTPPSFHNPKSVIVIGLPAVQPSVAPPLRPADPSHISCLLQPKVAIPVEGAPLVFSTSLAHNLVLHLNHVVPGPDGKPGLQDLPLVPDPFQGGLTIAPAPSPRKELPDPDADGQPNANAKPAPKPAPPSVLKPGEALTGTIEGMWGFDHFIGTSVPLQGLPGAGWHIATSSETPTILIAGQPNHLQLVSDGTACIQSITLEPAGVRAEWKLAGTTDDKAGAPAGAKPADNKTNTPVATSTADPATKGGIDPSRPVDLTLNLQHAATPGTIQLAIQQFGQAKPDQLGTKTFSEPAQIEAVAFHEGDRTIALTGTSLRNVKSVAVNDQVFAPELGVSDHSAILALPADAKPLPLKNGDLFTTKITLTDGRTLDAPSAVLIPRPQVKLLSKRIIVPPPAPAPATASGTDPSTPPLASPIKLSSTDDLPLGDQLAFFVKSDQRFPRNEQIEVTSADDSLHTTLSIAAGTLILQDSKTVLARLDPLKTFGTSAFGPLRFRAVAADGTPGEWLSLATLVRLPTLTDLHCPADATKPCMLDGSDLYLIGSVADDPSFATPTDVPEGFVDAGLPIPHPPAAGFFLRLRDDPTVVQSVTLPIISDASPAPTPHHSAHSGAGTPGTVATSTHQPAANAPTPPPQK